MHFCRVVADIPLVAIICSLLFPASAADAQETRQRQIVAAERECDSTTSLKSNVIRVTLERLIKDIKIQTLLDRARSLGFLRAKDVEEWMSAIHAILEPMMTKKRSGVCGESTRKAKRSEACRRRAEEYKAAYAAESVSALNVFMMGVMEKINATDKDWFMPSWINARRNDHLFLLCLLDGLCCLANERNKERAACKYLWHCPAYNDSSSRLVSAPSLCIATWLTAFIDKMFNLSCISHRETYNAVASLLELKPEFSALGGMTSSDILILTKKLSIKVVRGEAEPNAYSFVYTGQQGTCDKLDEEETEALRALDADLQSGESNHRRQQITFDLSKLDLASHTPSFHERFLWALLIRLLERWKVPCLLFKTSSTVLRYGELCSSATDGRLSRSLAHFLFIPYKIHFNLKLAELSRNYSQIIGLIPFSGVFMHVDGLEDAAAQEIQRISDYKTEVALKYDAFLAPYKIPYYEKQLSTVAVIAPYITELGFSFAIHTYFSAEEQKRYFSAVFSVVSEMIRSIGRANRDSRSLKKITAIMSGDHKLFIKEKIAPLIITVFNESKATLEKTKNVDKENNAREHREYDTGKVLAREIGIVNATLEFASDCTKLRLLAATEERAPAITAKFMGTKLDKFHAGLIAELPLAECYFYSAVMDDTFEETVKSLQTVAYPSELALVSVRSGRGRVTRKAKLEKHEMELRMCWESVTRRFYRVVSDPRSLRIFYDGDPVLLPEDS